MTDGIIAWYEKISQDPAFNDIATLMQKRGQLSAELYKLSVTLQRVMAGHRKADYMYEIAMKRKVIDLTAMTDNATGRAYSHAKAEAMARVDFLDEGLKLAEQEGTIDGWKIRLRQGNAVLEAMRQDIAELRKLRDNE